MKISRLIHLASVCICASISSQLIADDTQTLNDNSRHLVMNIADAHFMPVREGWAFDYTLAGGAGLLNTFEYLRSLLSYADLQQSLSIPIFVQGPHSRSKLDLTNNAVFGHYNPEFVIALQRAILPMLDDSDWLEVSRGPMNDFGLLHKLAQLTEIHDYINENEDEFYAIQADFSQRLAEGNWPEGGYRGYVPQTLDGGHYWNWAETAYFFWIRRDLDETRKLWSALFSEIIRAYQ